MFQLISQCKLCDIKDEANWPHNHNLSKLGRVPLRDVTYQVSKVWVILFSGKNIFNVSLNNLLIEEKSGKL